MKGHAMKKMIASAAVVGALLAAGAAGAQDFKTYKPRASVMAFNYEISLPLGSFGDDFVSDTSYRGFSFEYRSLVTRNVSAGFGFTYNRFDETIDEEAVTLANGGLLTGPVYRSADQLAAKALFHLYLRDEGTLRPYAGVGLGGVWTYAYAQTTDLSNTEDGFDFIVSPEAGFALTAAKGASSVGLNAAVRYNYTTFDFSDDVENIQSLGFVMGLFASF
jgi:outer membrane protein W